MDATYGSRATHLARRMALRTAAGWLAVLLAFALALPVLAATPARLVTPVAGEDKLLPRIEYLEDGEGRYTIEDAMRAYDAGRFQALPAGTQANFGLSRSVYWLRLSFSLTEGAAPERLLEVAYPFLGSVILYGNDGKTATGATLPFASRPVPHRNFVFPLTLRTGEPATYYLRVTSEGTLTIPVHLWLPEALHEAAQSSYFLLGLYYGEFIALLLYNLILFLTLRDRAYLAYIAFITVMAITNLSYNGLGMQFVWPYWPTEGRAGLTVTLALSAIFSMQFSRIFLNTRQTARRVDMALQFMSGIFVVALGVALFDLRTAFLIMAVSGLFFPALCLGAGIVSLRNGHTTARFFLLGWSALLVGTILYTMRTLNLVPANFFTLNAIQLGTAGELLLFSFALADRTRTLIQKNAELHERELQLREAAHRDPLTGLGNRLLLDDRLKHALQMAQRQNSLAAVLLVDLDHFKPVNDRFGHAAGDALLKAVAGLLLNAVRASDTVTRMGGDEFVLVIEGLHSRDEAYRLAEKIRSELTRPMTVASQPLAVSASVGVAVYPDDAALPDDLLRRADEAMYRDKERGRTTEDLVAI